MTVQDRKAPQIPLFERIHDAQQNAACEVLSHCKAGRCIFAKKAIQNYSEYIKALQEMRTKCEYNEEIP